MKYLTKYNEGIVDKFKDYFNKPLRSEKEPSWSDIKMELNKMVHDISQINISKNLSEKGEVHSKNLFKKEIKKFLNDYRDVPSIVKDDNGFYKLDLSKFIKDPSPWIFNREQMNKALLFFNEDYLEISRRSKEVGGYMTNALGEEELNSNYYITISNPYLKPPVVDVNKIMKKINEEDDFYPDLGFKYEKDRNLIKKILKNIFKMKKSMEYISEFYVKHSMKMGVDLYKYLYGKIPHLEFYIDNNIIHKLSTWMWTICMEYDLNMDKDVGNIYYSIGDLRTGMTKEKFIKNALKELNNLKKYSKNISNYLQSYNGNLELPNKNYPFTFNLSYIHQFVDEWYKVVFENIGKSFMKDKAHKYMKKINENKSQLNKKDKQNVSYLLGCLLVFDRMRGELVEKWYLDHIYDIDLNDYLSGVTWTDHSLDEYSMEGWIEEVSNYLEIEIDFPKEIEEIKDVYYNYKENFPKESKNRFIMYVCSSLYQMIQVAKIISKIAEKTDYDLMNSTPLEQNVISKSTDLKDLGDQMNDWAYWAIDDLSKMAMEEKIGKYLKKINKD